MVRCIFGAELSDLDHLATYADSFLKILPDNRGELNVYYVRLLQCLVSITFHFQYSGEYIAMLRQYKTQFLDVIEFIFSKSLGFL